MLSKVLLSCWKLHRLVQFQNEHVSQKNFLTQITKRDKSQRKKLFLSVSGKKKETERKKAENGYNYIL